MTDQLPGLVLPRHRGNRPGVSPFMPADTMNVIGIDDRGFGPSSANAKVIKPLLTHPDYPQQFAMARLEVPWHRNKTTDLRRWFRGTGWLYGEDLLVTATHVLHHRVPGDTVPDETDVDYQALHTAVTMVMKPAGPITPSGQREVLSYEIFGEVAVMVLKPLPAAAPIDIRWDGVGTSTKANILQFPGGKFAFAYRANDIVPVPSGDLIFHVADSGLGASGGPILDNSGKAFGIHIEAVELKDLAARCAALVFPYDPAWLPVIEATLKKYERVQAGYINLGLSLAPFRAQLEGVKGP